MTRQAKLQPFGIDVDGANAARRATFDFRELKARTVAELDAASNEFKAKAAVIRAALDASKHEFDAEAAKIEQRFMAKANELRHALRSARRRPTEVAQ